VGRPEGNRPLGRSSGRWVDNIKLDFREIGWDGMDWIDLAQEGDQWRALMITVMNLLVPQNAEKLSCCTISIEETKIMAFSGKDPVRSKICRNNKTLEQVNTLNHLRCILSYEGEKDMPSKISKFVETIGVINQVFKPSSTTTYKIKHLQDSSKTGTDIWK
jgi:hypothetical protein